MDSDIRDQAYQFFLEEAPELLQTIEAGILKLRRSRDTATVHSIMRAAHSLKGGAASVGLDTIKVIAHRLETIFKALYSEHLEINSILEGQLLQAFDCLRLPLTQQLTKGSFDQERALAISEPILTQLEIHCKQAIIETENFIPSSSDLGINMTTSIFEVDVQQGLERLANVLSNPQAYEVAGELHAQAEVFYGFAELLNLPGFAHIAQTVIQAIEANPDRAVEITELALQSFQAGREAVLAGDNVQGGSPSPDLLALTEPIPLALTRSSSLIEVDASSEIITSEEMTTLLEQLGETPEAIHLLADLDLPLFDPGEPVQSEITAAVIESAIPEQPASLEDFFADLQPTGILPGNDTNQEDAESPVFSHHDNSEWVAESSVAQANPAETQIEETEAEETEAEATQVEIAQVEIAQATQAEATQAEATQAEIAQATQAAPLLNSVEQPMLVGSLSLPPDISIQPRYRAQLTNRGKRTMSAGLSVRVDAGRLARMNNVLGELTINRNGLVLQQEQMRTAIRELSGRFERFQAIVEQLRSASDQLLIAPERRSASLRANHPQTSMQSGGGRVSQVHPLEFDSLEMDSYTNLYSHTQTLLEEMVQLEESMGDIALFNRQSEQMLELHRKMLSRMQDDLRWARMVALGEVLNRFPRILRDLSDTYQKPVNLTLSGTELLVDKAVLEKLYSPLLHLLRNGFDHGIESPEDRQTQGKPPEGQIQIQAYYKGRQIVIEVRDDGRGLDLSRIRQRVVELEWLSLEETTRVTDAELAEFIFEPGFSTATQVSELSGRGMGLDVVREQLQALKGTIAVQSTFGQGTVFRLTLPLTLTIANLLVCFVGTTPVALLSNSITEIIIPKPEEITQTPTQRFVEWQNQQVPAYRLSDLLTYSCLIPEMPPSRVLAAVPSPANWETPMLILQRGKNAFALQVDRLVTEQELVIKPFGVAITPPSYANGCTVLGDGSLVPVIDGLAFLDALLNDAFSNRNGGTPRSAADALTAMIAKNTATGQGQPSIRVSQATTVLVVDDAVTSRRMLATSLGRAGYRVLQARDGQEALEQLQQSQSVQLIVCDIEMPNMNGFEFLTQRRQNPDFAQIPTVMLTSRSNDKHRWLAMQLGATAYFTKPYLEQEFLNAIAEYTQADG